MMRLALLCLLWLPALVLAAAPQRIVSLAPHITEMLFTLGAGERIVGAVEYSNYPPAARAIPRVGGVERIDYERILALEPDLVLVWSHGGSEERMRRLRGLGLKVEESDPRRLADIPEELERLGRLIGRPEAGHAAAAAFRERWRRLEVRYRDKRPLRVFYEIWHRPLITIGGRHFISDVIRLCGGVNVFSDLEPLAPTVDPEAVLAADPEVIIASGLGARRPEWLEAWRRWPGLSAVREGHLYAIDADIMQRPTSRLLDGAQALCELLDRAR